MAGRLPERSADADCVGESRRPPVAASPDRPPPLHRPLPAPRLFISIARLQSQRARTLGALLVGLDEYYQVQARRAPDVRQACVEAVRPARGARRVMSLRALLGLIGAHEWRTKGIDIPALGARIHPHYGVFAPIRSEYVDLVATAPLPALTASTAWPSISEPERACWLRCWRGAASGMWSPRTSRPGRWRCARENIERLGLQGTVDIQEADLFPRRSRGAGGLQSAVDSCATELAAGAGIYDPDSRMLKGFLSALPEHLAPAGEGWLILSDLAEHLGLRSRDELLAAFDSAHLQVLDRQDIQPQHPRATMRATRCTGRAPPK